MIILNARCWFSLGLLLRFGCWCIQLRGDQAENGRELRFGIKFEISRRVPVHCRAKFVSYRSLVSTECRLLTMNGKGGDPQNWPLDLDEFRRVCTGLVGDDYTPGDGQVTVEPGVPDATTVSLNADLQVIRFRPLGNGAYLC